MYRTRLKNEAGYTLLEAILQIMVFALFAQLFLVFFYWKAPIDRQYKNASTVAWEMFAADFQDEIVDLQSIEVIRSGQGIRFEKERGMIIIELGNRVIRKRVDGLGHVPLITEIVHANFKLNEPILHVEVLMEDGTELERDFIIGKNSR